MHIGINVLPLHSGHKSRGIGYYTKNLLNNLKKSDGIKVLEFKQLSEVINADVIHYPWFDLYFHTLPLIRSYPTVVTIHDVIPLIFSNKYPVGFKGKVNCYLQKMALNSCQFIITDSECSKNDIHQYLKISKHRIVTIPLAADPEFKVLKDQELIRIKRKYNLPENFLMYTGDANWVKNLPFLLKGFNSLLKTAQYKEIKLALIGGVFLKNVEDIDHPELASLKELNRMIKEYNLEDKIIRPGHIDDQELAAFYNLAVIYIQPSFYEGFGLPVLQAFQCGTPVMSSNKGSLPEVGGQASLYFDPNDINKFVSLLMDILPDKSLQYKLSKLGFEQAKKFYWKKAVNQTIAVYNQALRN